jgi:hypothetical protein
MWLDCHYLESNSEDLMSRRLVWGVNVQDPIKSTGPHQCRVLFVSTVPDLTRSDRKGIPGRLAYL